VNENTVVLVAGDATHPEVQGIVGHCKTECIVFGNSSELEEIAEKCHYLSEKEILVVAQTTFSTKEWNLCKKKIKKLRF
jgi:4-hydroxy-3-methylbut-2-enyl diphosphate reductase